MDLLIRGASRLGINLSYPQLEQFDAYFQELSDWNSRMNLTAITDPDEVKTKHFLDSLTLVIAYPESDMSSVSSVIDVGSGAGFPGIPLKIAFPHLRLVLLEATLKKARFLTHVSKTLGLRDVDVVPGRAEELAHNADYREQFSLVVARALTKLASLVELTMPFCAVGGRVVAHKKGDIAAEVASASRVIALTGGRLSKLVPVRLQEFPDERLLVIIDKISETPRPYPRHNGLPAKNPILS